jgi:hypothetical protein
MRQASPAEVVRFERPQQAGEKLDEDREGQGMGLLGKLSKSPKSL